MTGTIGTLALPTLLWIMLGGGCGAAVRYLLTVTIPPFPASVTNNRPFLHPAILLANLLGSGILGFLTGLYVMTGHASRTLFVALSVGLCGGLTTFSTAMVELAQMLMDTESTESLSTTILRAVLGAVFPLAVAMSAYGIALLIGHYVGQHVW